MTHNRKWATRWRSLQPGMAMSYELLRRNPAWRARKRWNREHRTSKLPRGLARLACITPRQFNIAAASQANIEPSCTHTREIAEALAQKEAQG